MSKIDNRSLKILREALPIDGSKIIQERLNEYTIDYINKILNGTRYSPKVIEVALEIAKEEKDKKIALQNQIAELGQN
ncbi:MAG: hypothetical protein ACOYM0_01245 [Bacteroidales bacterium]